MKHSSKRNYNGAKPDPKSQLNLGNTVAAFMTDSGEDLYLTMIYNKHREREYGGSIPNNYLLRQIRANEQPT